MGVVDLPGSPGLDYDGLAALLRGFLASPRCLLADGLEPLTASRHRP